ncbi:MAG: helix-turn-helix domain-containing protein [Agathobacter sp.]|nr:helix-turn-helix domain-containing protein [Agathobacter sp.]MBQ6812724.1 helix-turn-helix domain-containing protein [Agathobacter sp.]
MENYTLFCDMFYNAHYLPIALYDKEGFVCSSGFYEEGDPYPFVLPKLLANESPSLYASSDTGHYGLVKCADNNHYFVLGPTYSTNVTEEIIRAYIKKNAISPSRYGEIASFLSNIPQYSYNHFVNLLLYLHYTLTGEKLSLTHAFGITDTQFQTQIGQQYTEKNYLAREEKKKHGTYDFEQHMLHLIQTGEVAQLEEFLLTAASTPQMNEGKLAETPLRQAKNLFIGLITMVGKFAAIPGGMDVEQTYQLIDTYIQECEKLQTIEGVKNLQYNMPIDFAKRIAQQQLPPGISTEIHDCMQFISAHVNEPIGVADVVAYSRKSRAYLFQKFKEELGMTIGSYITECRLREAKSLLKYTDKTLGEISSYLCFSSQSYFQNVFKKHFNMTPTEYRSNNGIN